MRIREEIEKLRHPPDHFLLNFVSIDDVLSILDKWELVAETEWLTVFEQDQLEDGRDWILLEMNMPEEFLEGIHKVKLGEHIAIYRRK